MYLEHLSVRNLKRIRKLDLSFEGRDGPRMWTMLIGENGTGKTSVLHAIALAAAGHVRANSLGQSVLADLPSRLPRAGELQVSAGFGLGPSSSAAAKMGWQPADGRLAVWLRKPYGDLVGSSAWVAKPKRWKRHLADAAEQPEGNALGEARSRDLSGMFVAGYGVHRALPKARDFAQHDWRSSTERMRSLFEAADLVSLRFSELLDRELAEGFRRALNAVVSRQQGPIPGLQGVSFRTSGIRSKYELEDTYSVTQTVGSAGMPVPTTALSHGFQSSLAWLADLVGHVIRGAVSACSSGV